MQQRIHNGTEYFVSGDEPRILLCSGIHGDECGVVDSVCRFLEKEIDASFSYVYIPRVSPSAVARGTRVNKDGDDLNRCFLEHTHSSEARAAIDIIHQFKLRTCVSFHEDPIHTDFYLYDSGELEESRIEQLRLCITALGVGLLNGVDDPDDPVLGHVFTDGYKSNIDTNQLFGPLESWLVRSAGFVRVYGIEVPGELEQEKKDELVHALFKCLTQSI